MIEVVDTVAGVGGRAPPAGVDGAVGSVAVVVDAAGPSGTVAEQLRPVCDRLVVSTTRDLAVACGVFYDAVMDGTARVRPSLVMNQAAITARRRQSARCGCGPGPMAGRRWWRRRWPCGSGTGRRRNRRLRRIGRRSDELARFSVGPHGRRRRARRSIRRVRRCARRRTGGTCCSTRPTGGRSTTRSCGGRTATGRTGTR